MTQTNLVTITNVDKMKCHINGLVALPWIKNVTYMEIEQAMSHFDYETEQIETVVFAYIREIRNIVFV